MSEFITPPHTFERSDLPVVFLAGPVQGAPDWQRGLGAQLLRSGFHMNIASPRRTDEDMASFTYNEQVDWELDHLKQAIKLGVVVINVVAQDLSLPYKPDRPYWQTTRWEAGGAILGMELYGGQAEVVGRIDPDFDGHNLAYFRAVAARNNVKVVSSEGELITQVLKRLPLPTRSIPS